LAFPGGHSIVCVALLTTWPEIATFYHSWQVKRLHLYLLFLTVILYFCLPTRKLLFVWRIQKQNYINPIPTMQWGKEEGILNEK